jgi:hypothetical protein
MVASSSSASLSLPIGEGKRGCKLIEHPAFSPNREEAGIAKSRGCEKEAGCVEEIKNIVSQGREFQLH